MKTLRCNYCGSKETLNLASDRPYEAVIQALKCVECATSRGHKMTAEQKDHIVTLAKWVAAEVETI